ncbi:TPA: BglG family transcription antiterminator [Listeria innocua]|uniref:Lin0425 protein n=1 Tax=Listeria innocua serovar 6a (strain ATCC BAA-680 / CLIP 11262) TaxID=272626 RepID=Q92EN3_LISIN|nr:PRD domain-containing protein [Listeria innocua]ECC1680996.1 PRD domain-containing protein [Listeria innocua]EEQ0537456.1 BglG family transcription antiterminator [Listeria innocua]EHD9219212.1 BglG family transcription antiterminator [Listeria innocua]EHF3594837.1 BglG family transcription antiterminator [Listeria innocua]EHF3597800.1 BglG family transcription antiterminator [Listeria innocua]
MGYFAYKRLETLFGMLLDAGSHLSAQKLSQDLHISERTIRTDIAKLTEFLETNGATITLTRGAGYKIEILDPTAFEAFQADKNKPKNTDYFDLDNPEERVKYEIFLLLSSADYIKLEDLADTLFASRATISNDMKQVRTVIASYDLTLVSKPGCGVKIVGEEEKMRYTLTALIASKKAPESYLETFFEWHKQKEKLQKLMSAVTDYFFATNIRFTDEALQNLLLHMMILVERIELGHSLEQFELTDVSEEEITIANNLAGILASLFEIEISEGDKNYLLLQIASKRILNVEDKEISEFDDYAYIEGMLNRIESQYFYRLQDDLQLKKDLIAHIHSMLYRVKYHMTVKNPMTEHIKRYYPLAYEITLDAVESLKKDYPYDINQNELAYLALHIGASLERNYQISYYRHKSALIVCGSGFGTARIVEAKVKSAVSNLDITKVVSIQEYNRFIHIEEDIILSTVRIPEKNKPVIKISNIPTNEELKMLGAIIEEQTDPNRGFLSSFFDAAFFARSTLTNKTAILEEMVESLKSKNIVGDEFLNSVIERERLGSTVLGTGIAIPHPLGLMAKETKIVIRILDNPIKWDQKQSVHAVFLLCISKNDYEEAINIYELLVELVREEYGEKLAALKSFTDFTSLANDILKKK